MEAFWIIALYPALLVESAEDAKLRKLYWEVENISDSLYGVLNSAEICPYAQTSLLSFIGSRSIDP